MGHLSILNEAAIRRQRQATQPGNILAVQPSAGTTAIRFAGSVGLAGLDRFHTIVGNGTPLAFNPEKAAIARLQKRGIMVVGANGLMGSGILQNARQGLFNTFAVEVDPLDAQRAVESTTQRISAAKQRGYVKEAAYREILGKRQAVALPVRGSDLTNPSQAPNIKPGDLPEDVGMVIEAIDENLPWKKTLFKNLEANLPPDTILATNTSSLSVDEIASGLKHPERVIGLHFFMPSVSNPLLEIIPGSKTSPEVVEQVRQYAEAVGKVPVVVSKDAPGFVGNRLLLSVMATEAMKLYDEGYGDSKTIDRVANKLFWPLGAEIPMFKDMLMPPFVMAQKYGRLGVAIANNFGRLGAYYQPSPTLIAEHQRVQSVMVPLAQDKRDLQEKRAEYDRLRAEMTARQPAQGLHRKDESFKALEARQAELKAQIQDLERHVSEQEEQAKYFPNGLPEPTNLRPEPLAVREKLIEQRLLGAYHATRLQMVAEGLAKFDDIDNMARLGFKWTIRPRSKSEIQAALKAMPPELNIPQIEEPEQTWIKVSPVSADGVQTITLNRVQDLMGKENFNTLGMVTLKAIKAAVEKANADPRVRTIVFAANGGNIFCGGANLEEVLGKTDLQEMETLLRTGRETMDAIANSPKVTIAKVNGDTYGGGVELALACDYVVASDQATFTLPEVNWGIVPGWGGTERLPEKVGKPLAKALILYGKTKIGVVSGIAKQMPFIEPLVNRVLRWDMDTPGFRLDARSAQEVGLAQLVVPHAMLNDALNQVLAQGELKKPHARRGLKQFATPADYPDSVRQKYRLDTIEADSRRETGVFSVPAWHMANALIEKAGTPAAGTYTEEEMRKIVRGAAQKHQRLQGLIEASLEGLKGKTVDSGRRMAATLLLNGELLPGALQAVTGKRRPLKAKSGSGKSE